jgi:hypothetical protein
MAKDLILAQSLLEAEGTGARNRTGFSGLGLKKVFPLFPLTIFISVFFFWPIGAVFINAFKNNDGSFTWANYQLLFQEPYNKAFYNSVKLGLISALTGAIPGTLVAIADCTKRKRSTEKIHCFHKWSIGKYGRSASCIYVPRSLWARRSCNSSF